MVTLAIIRSSLSALGCLDRKSAAVLRLPGISLDVEPIILVGNHGPPHLAVRRIKVSRFFQYARLA